MVLLCGMKLTSGYIGSRASLEELCCMPISATFCALPETTWYELKSDLQMVAACAGLGSTEERLNHDLMPGAASAGHRVA